MHRIWMLLSSLLAICTSSQAAAPFDYATNLGVVSRNANAICLEIADENLAAGQRVRLVIEGAEDTAQQIAGEAEVIRKAGKACAAVNPDAPGADHYELKLLHGSLDESSLAFAIANFTGDLKEGSGGITADLDGDGKIETFRTCNGVEGVHLTVWKGKPLKGARKWHYYFHLGYDVEPDCTNSDY